MRQKFKLLLFTILCSLFGIYTQVYSQVTNTDTTKKTLSPEEIQAYNDSIAAMRTYMKSKRYNDSIDALRKARMDSIRAHQDSVKRENIRYQDSMRQSFELKKKEQQLYIDSIKNEKQKVIDSLNQVKKYRESKHYKDSVSKEKQRQLDSMKHVRQLYMDSMKSEQQRQLDSLKQLQQRRNDSLQLSIQQRRDSLQVYIDSVRNAQQQFKDSLEIVKQKRIDSLNQLKKDREKELYDKDKQRQKDLRDKEKEKIQKERDSYTNDVFLKKRWGFRRRIFQNTYTRYNYYYNATNKIKEAENNMYISKIDNFDSMLSLYPYDPASNPTMFANDMDSLAKRLAIGIQIHDPRSKWQDDLYLLLGKAYYYKGDFNNAALVFEYVINYDKKYEIQKSKDKKDKKKSSSVLDLDTDKSGLAGLLQHKLAKNEALIWLSRTYIKKKEYDKAQILLDMIIIDENANDKIKAEAFEMYANLYLENNQVQSALPYLDSIAFNPYVDKRVRQRAAFIGGQLYMDNSDWENAGRLFTKVSDLNAPVELELNAELNKVIALTYSGKDNYQQVIRQLNRMGKEDKYKMYYDKINLSLAQTYLKKGDKDKAIESYQKSIELAVNSPVTKGTAFYELGELYYNDRKYVLAQNAYDSAAYYLHSTEKKDYYTRASTISKNLQAVSGPASQIELIDSLLTLSKLSEKEKLDWARNELKKYEQRKSNPTTPGSTSPSTPGKGNWYFLNADQVSKGSQEFKQTWGDRPLVDNWRRSSEIRFTGNVGGVTTTEPGMDGSKVDVNYFLAQIPSSPQVIDSLNKQLEKAYTDLEKSFFITEEYAGIKNLYKDFYQKYPYSQYLDMFYHDLFFIYLREPNIDSANFFKQKLVNEFPNSSYAKTVKEMDMNKMGDNSFVDYRGIEAHMDETYRMLQAQMFTDVITRTEEVKKEYPVQLPKYQNQYQFMKAVAYAGLQDYAKADTLLKEIINVSQNDTLKLHAQDVLNYIKQIQNVSTDDTTHSISSNLSFLDPSLMNSQYLINKNEKHFVLIYVDKYDNRIMPARAGINDFNIMNKSSLNLKTSFSELKNNERLIVIKEFKNDNQAKSYINELKQQKALFKDYNISVDLKFVTISESNFIILLNKKDFLEYLSFFNKNY